MKKFEQSTRGSLTAEGLGVGRGEAEDCKTRLDVNMSFQHSLPLRMELCSEPALGEGTESKHMHIHVDK